MKFMSKQTKFLIVIAVIAAIGGFIVSSKYYNNEDEYTFQSLLEYPIKKTFTGFELNDHNNNKVTIDNFSGKWTLLFFGFTHCPDICPTTLAELQKVFKLIDTTEKPEVLFISVDPERDTPEHLKQYTTYFNPQFNSASADPANLLSMTSQVGVAFHLEEHETGDLNYNVDHTAAIFLVSPEKQLHGIFRIPHDAKKIATDLMQLLDNS
jgi:protein SCO1/2